MCVLLSRSQKERGFYPDSSLCTFFRDISGLGIKCFFCGKSLLSGQEPPSHFFTPCHHHKKGPYDCWKNISWPCNILLLPANASTEHLSSRLHISFSGWAKNGHPLYHKKEEAKPKTQRIFSATLPKKRRNIFNFLIFKVGWKWVSEPDIKTCSSLIWERKKKKKNIKKTWQTTVCRGGTLLSLVVSQAKWYHTQKALCIAIYDTAQGQRLVLKSLLLYIRTYYLHSTCSEVISPHSSLQNTWSRVHIHMRKERRKGRKCLSSHYSSNLSWASGNKQRWHGAHKKEGTLTLTRIPFTNAHKSEYCTWLQSVEETFFKA